MMATPTERAALLAVACPWCEAAPGSECIVRGVRRPRGQRGPRTLDGRCHDARWMAALGRPAPVLARNITPGRRASQIRSDEPGTVGVMERPW